MGHWRLYDNEADYAALEKSSLKELITAMESLYFIDGENNFDGFKCITYWRDKGTFADTERRLPEWIEQQIYNFLEITGNEYIEEIESEYKHDKYLEGLVYDRF